MSRIFPSRYQLKRALYWPHTVFMRWKYRKVVWPVQTILEQYYYRTAATDFIAAVQANPQLLYDAKLDFDSVVLDVGAAAGDWAQQVADRYDPLIYAFEADPKQFAKLQELAIDNPKMQLMPYYPGAVDGSVVLVGSGTEAALPTSRRGHADVQKSKGSVVAVDKVWEDMKLGQIDLMRIDIEGGEFSLLEKMNRADLLNKVNCFVIQFHEWHSGAYERRLHIREELSRTHRLEWEYDFIWEKWVRI